MAASDLQAKFYWKHVASDGSTSEPMVIRCSVKSRLGSLVTTLCESVPCERLGVVAGSFLFDSGNVPDVSLGELDYAPQQSYALYTFSEGLLGNGFVPRSFVPSTASCEVRCVLQTGFFQDDCSLARRLI